MTNALDRADGLSAHDIMRDGRLAPSRRDPHPFLPLIAYLALLCPATPDLREPDEGLDAEDDRYAGLLCSACAIRDHLLSGTPDLAVVRIQIGTLRAEATALAKRLDAEPMFLLDVSAERAVTLTIRIAQIADVCLAGCGDRDALVRLAEAAEACAALCASGYQAFATGARHVLATQEDLGEWRPGQPPIPVIGTAIQVGRNALARLEHKGRRANARPTHAEEMDDDRAGLVLNAGPKPVPVKPTQAAAPEPQVPGAVIFPASMIERHRPDLKRDIKAALGPALGAHLRHVPVPRDRAAWTRERLEAFPWTDEAIEAFRDLQGNREHFGGAVLGLVGTTGCGKSALAAELITSSGLHLVRYNADAATENSFLGTHARWNTGHLGVSEKALADAGATSAGVMVDELEKASGTRNSNGGRLHDGLHGVWEDSTGCQDGQKARDQGRVKPLPSLCFSPL